MQIPLYQPEPFLKMYMNVLLVFLVAANTHINVNCKRKYITYFQGFSSLQKQKNRIGHSPFSQLIVHTINSIADLSILPMPRQGIGTVYITYVIHA